VEWLSEGWYICHNKQNAIVACHFCDTVGYVKGWSPKSKSFAPNGIISLQMSETLSHGMPPTESVLPLKEAEDALPFDALYR
jgi:hypothetical protein